MSHYGAGLVDELKEVTRSYYEQLKEKRLASQTVYPSKWEATRGFILNQFGHHTSAIAQYCAGCGRESR